jgi:hypothetical protein
MGLAFVPRCPGGAPQDHRHLGNYSIVDTPMFTID